jgi:4-amino-4-deoxy-L-arabinose transferase-like glycosyltransferase
MNKYTFLLTLIFLGALALRIVGLSSYPVGFTQDEAGIGYDAYSILLTGKDQWGESWPLILRSFGDFKTPLYSYLAIPSVYLFGLNEFGVRLPNAVFGSLAAVATYLMVVSLTRRKDFGLASALLLAISPWHIGLSRGAFEANLTTFFIPLGVWAFIKGIEKPKFMILSGVLFGLNLFSYHSARFFTPILVIVLVLAYFKEFKRIDATLKQIVLRYKWGLVAFAVFLSLAALTMFGGGAKRGLDITILSPTDKWVAVSDRRYEATLQGLPDFYARLFSNKASYVFDLFSKNYLSYFSTTFLFSEGAGEWNYGLIPGRGVLYLIEVVFVLASIFSFIKRRGFNKMGFVLTWILIAPIPAALTKGPGFAANRAATMIPGVQVLSAWGLVYLYDLTKNRLGNLAKRLLVATTAVILLVSFLSFLEDYRYHAPVRASKAMQYGMKDIVDTINSRQASYEKVFLSRSLSVPNIWIQFYLKMDPRQVQEASRAWLRYEAKGVKYLDQLDEYILGKYVFGDLVLPDLKGQNYLVVGRPEEFPSSAKRVAEFSYLDGSPSYIMVDANEL